MSTKFVFVTGGVVSGLGKGITAASLGRLLKSRGYTVSMQKLDPYINVDPGMMSPYQHGEVFVTDDGAQTDLDLGHYERFIDENLTINSSVTTGKIYWSVLQKERQGGYQGGTVQVIPHITNEIKDRIYTIAREDKPDVLITEIGGTVGDIEGLPFLETIRQMRYEEEPGNVINIHVTLIPYLTASGELKTKPTQHSVKELLSIGIQPDVLVCRAEVDVPDDVKKKLALFCNVSRESVIINQNAESLYSIPLMLEEEGLARVVLQKLHMEERPSDLTEWKAMVDRHRNAKDHVTIALVGKYVELRDAYLSAVEALTHSGIACDTMVDIRWLQAEQLNDDTIATHMAGVHGVIIPGGAGQRGSEGFLCAIRYARENKIPYLGLAYGMQMSVVEYAQNVMGLDANTAEIDPDAEYVLVDLPPSAKALGKTIGNLRVGRYSCSLKEGTLLAQIYNTPQVQERHFHSYEINNDHVELLEEAGLKVSGYNEERKVVEAVELTGHPWYVAAQFQPEFSSRPNRPHPLYTAFVRAAQQHQGHQMTLE